MNGNVSFFVCGSFFFKLIGCYKMAPRLIHNRPGPVIAPGRCALRMPGTGPLRRSSGPARKKAIVGKSVTKANGKLGGCQFPCNRGILPFFGDVAQCQINELSGCLITGKVPSLFEHFA
jgi:hypothetical protein